MEKVIFRNSRKQSLVGNLYVADSDSVIIMCHGATGDKSEWGRFDKIAESLNKQGYNVLSFDFSGCGESDNDTLTLDKEIDDLNSAINFVKSKDYQRISFFGHSLGGLVCLKCFSSEILTMVLWAPLTDKLKYSWWKKKYPEEILREFNKKGYIARIRDTGVRRKILIDKQLIKDYEDIDQKKLLKKINCPVLILHGKKDLSLPFSCSEKAIKLLSKESKLKLVDTADHGFYNHIDVIINSSIDWFLTHMKP